MNPLCIVTAVTDNGVFLQNAFRKKLLQTGGVAAFARKFIP